MAIHIIKDEKTGKEVSYYIDNRIKRNFDNKLIPSLHKKDKDAVICIDGNEGSGKTYLALQLGRYVDPSLDLSRICFTAEEFRDAIYKAKKGQCVIYDEAFTGLSSRSSLSGINRMLVSLMMQMRQNNLFVIIVLPTFFLLDKYVALFRTKALIHVYEVNGVRGYFKVYNRRLKKLLYLMGKHTYSYNPTKIRTGYRGRFYGVFALGDNKHEEYIKRKAKALKETENTPMSAGQAKYKEQRDVLLHLVRKFSGLNYRELSSLLEEYQIEMSFVQIRHICIRFGDKDMVKPDKILGEQGESLGKSLEKADI